MRKLRLLPVLVAVLLTGLLPGPARAVDEAPQNTSAPYLKGDVRTGGIVSVHRGVWSPAPGTWRFAWYRGGDLVAVTEENWRRLTEADFNRNIWVEVRGYRGTSVGTARTAQVPVRAGVLQLLRAPSVTGVRRWDHTLEGWTGRWWPGPASASYRWYRGAAPVADSKRYRLRVQDFGHRMRLRVRVSRYGYRDAFGWSPPTGVIDHRVAANHWFTYSVRTRGSMSTSVDTFRRQVQETFGHPAGWRAAGFSFRPVRSGGDFTVVLSEARYLPSFSPVCSVQWSCRVGRYVIINQDRWKYATKSWNAAGGSLRDYRHMVVDHEVGHWLGHGHAGCSGSGALAPVMQTQSKGLDGCRFNPWPLPRERWTSRGARGLQQGQVGSPFAVAE